jgi:hypothetical protein
MQTYANALPGSSDIEIAGNDCRGTDLHQCVMAEGPGSTDGGGGGGGRSRNWWVHDNYFACHANQNVSFRNVTNSVIERNTFAGSGAKAVQLTDGSTNVTVRGNNLGSGYGTVAGD